MKLKIEKSAETGLPVITLTLDGKRKPVVIEGEQLKALLSTLEVAASADRFCVEIEVRQ